MRNKIFIVAAVLLTALVFSACSGVLPDSDNSQEDQVATANAIIVESANATATTIAMQTRIAQLETQVVQPTTVTIQTQVVTATLEPVTPTPTNTLVPPTPTPIPPTPTPDTPCNMAQFIADVTIADGSVLSPGAYFTKTWRLKNTGLCAWTTAYDLVFVSGDGMGAASSYDLPGSVAPGQVIDISVGLTAPGREGNFRGYWKLRDPNGALFGLGRGNDTFYVDIRVQTPESKYPLDFVAAYCQAEWTSGAGTLPCSGQDSDSRGFVRRIDNPELESGYIDDEPLLQTHPQMVTDGIIRGKYPSIRVEQGHHFVAVIGCAYNANNCDVNFQLDYQIGNGSIQTIGSWKEVYDGQFNLVDVDLSGLAGNDVRFILTVFANGSYSQDRAQWLSPRIVKQ